LGMAAFPCCTDETRRPGMQAPAFGDQPSRANHMCTTVECGEQPGHEGRGRILRVAAIRCETMRIWRNRVWTGQD
jgi:hypothetical protein